MHSALRIPAAAAEPAPHADGSPWALPDAARFLGISLSTVERRVRDGTIASFRIGCRRLIADAELRRVAAGG